MNDSASKLTLYPGGEAQYSFRMYASYDHPICCTTTDPRVIEYVFSKVATADPFDPTWHLRIRLGPVHSTDVIVEIANEIKDEIFSRLSFTLNIKVDQIRMTGHSLTPMPGGGGIANCVLPMPTLAMQGKGGCRQLASDDIQVLQDCLAKAVPPPNSELFSLYRSALGTADPVAKFLILYLILYEVSGNVDQRAVDDLIKQHVPSTASAPWLRKDSKGKEKSTDETIYTRLRNEIAHRIGVSREKNRQEIISNLDPFQTIVHQALRS